MLQTVGQTNPSQPSQQRRGRARVGSFCPTSEARRRGRPEGGGTSLSSCSGDTLGGWLARYCEYQGTERQGCHARRTSSSRHSFAHHNTIVAQHPLCKTNLCSPAAAPVCSAARRMRPPPPPPALDRCRTGGAGCPGSGAAGLQTQMAESRQRLMRQEGRVTSGRPQQSSTTAHGLLWCSYHNSSRLQTTNKHPTSLRNAHLC